MRWSGMVLSGAVLVSVAAARADVRTETFALKDGHDLLALCSTPPSDPDFPESIGFCRGFGRGAIAYHRAVTPSGAPRMYCAPSPPPTEGSVLQRFVDWGNANPGKLDEPAVTVVFRFLKETFPCPK